jgi:hypothetical protein
MTRILLAAGCIAALALPVAAEPIVYPAKGQSADQQKKDQSQCATWATQQTGFDPAKPPPAAAPAAAPPVTGSGARVKGAAAGAIIGGASGGDAGDAAVAGAVVGGVAQRGANRRAAAQQQQAAGQQQQAAQGTYDKARAACMEGRGYTVK